MKKKVLIERRRLVDNGFICCFLCENEISVLNVKMNYKVTILYSNDIY